VDILLKERYEKLRNYGKFVEEVKKWKELEYWQVVEMHLVWILL
jgi:hypothetical protein